MNVKIKSKIGNQRVRKKKNQCVRCGQKNTHSLEIHSRPMKFTHLYEIVDGMALIGMDYADSVVVVIGMEIVVAVVVAVVVVVVVTGRGSVVAAVLVVFYDVLLHLSSASISLVP